MSNISQLAIILACMAIGFATMVMYTDHIQKANVELLHGLSDNNTRCIDLLARVVPRTTIE